MRHFAAEELSMMLGNFTTTLTCQIHEGVREEEMPAKAWLANRRVEYLDTVVEFDSAKPVSRLFHRMLF